jgi:hypothetical protein
LHVDDRAGTPGQREVQLSNAFRSYAAEFGIVGPAGRQNGAALIKRVLEDDIPGPLTN